MCRTEFSVRDIETTEEQSKFLRAIHVDTADANTSSLWVTPININDGVVSFKIDTVVNVTVISNKEYYSAKCGPLSPASKTLNGLSQKALDVHGQFTAQLQ